jgi:hypothetical protein
MTRAQLDSIEGFVITLANGAALVYPPAAPLASAIKALVETAEAHGIVPVELPEGQLRDIAAGMAAARASAVTSFKAHQK